MAYQQVVGVRLPLLSSVSVGHESRAWSPVAVPVMLNVGGRPAPTVIAKVYLLAMSLGTVVPSAASELAYARLSTRYCCSRVAMSLMNDCASARADLRSWLVYD